MTIVEKTPIAGPYNGNGVTTSFSFSFDLIAEDELVVTLTSAAGVETVQTLTTDYSVNPTGGSYPAASGTITMVTAPASGEKLTITRSTDIEQEVDLQNRKTVNPEVLEDALDRLTVICQDLAEQLGRALQLPVSGGLTDIAFPSPEASRLIGWNAAGTALQNYTPNSSSVVGLPAGSTDNALVRFNGTGGDTFDNSGVTIDDNDDVAGLRDLTTASLKLDTQNSRIGIGLTSPLAPLHISDTDPRIRLVDEDGSGRVDIRANASHGLIIEMDPTNADAATALQLYGDGSGIFRVDGTGVRIGGVTAPAVSLDIGGQTDAVRLPIGTTAQQPTGADGYVRVNSDNDFRIEHWDGSDAWKTILAAPSAGLVEGRLPYIDSNGRVAMLAAGSNGQVLTLASGIPSWADVAAGAQASLLYDQSVPSITASDNVTSVTDNGTGDFTINFTNNFANANYYATGIHKRTSAGTTSDAAGMVEPEVGTRSTSALQLLTVRANSGTQGREDSPSANVLVFGTLA